MGKFPAEARLRKNSDFQGLYREGKRFYGKFSVFLIKKNNKNLPRLGVNVSKKYAKQAVGRNYIKRINRVCFSDIQEKLPAFDVLLIIKPTLSAFQKEALMPYFKEQWFRLVKYLL